MKKNILISIIAFIISFNFAYGQPSSIANGGQSISHTTTLNTADQNMIFGSDVNAMLLNNDEMQSTQGFGFWSSVWDTIKNPWVAVPTIIGGTALCAVTYGAGCLTFAF
ncbi:hypothetical protein [Helicobacter sp. 13S00477-4]|uniref:hypothetical protein n=1 Tax=Helicobacter sp. 13S00477-4 TaxID=1905759 RepID=UPI000BA72EB7|nr:hypothetical protein [Helicobacter sp. 13S00477-4]PAF52146.1 hypothetical protein BKH44_03325 [Helicobacter sp. 13S00477-4]